MSSALRTASCAGPTAASAADAVDLALAASAAARAADDEASLALDAACFAAWDARAGCGFD